MCRILHVRVRYIFDTLISGAYVIDSPLPKKDLNKILLWAHTNRDLLVEVWNEFHGHRILVE